MNHIFSRTTVPSQAGIALVLVLWAVTLLALMATTLGRTQHGEAVMAGNLSEESKAEALMAAGLHFMMLQLERRNLPAPGNPWPVDGKLHPWHFAGHRLWIGAQAESTRLDLNHAEGEELLELFRSNGLDELEARALRDATLDWRDADGVARSNGAEDAEYLAMGRPVGAADAFFQSVDQLMLVRGMTHELLERLAPKLSVHSRWAFRLHVELEAPNGTLHRQTMVVDVRHRTPHGYRILALDPHPGATLPRARRQEESETGS